MIRGTNDLREPRPSIALVTLRYRPSTTEEPRCPMKLPEPIAAYFAGTNNHHLEAMLAAFTDGAVVKDEGQEKS